MRIVDTHCHVIDRSRLRYPWLATVPALDRDFLWTEYWPQAQAAGITGVVHMEVDVAEQDLLREVAMVASLTPAPAGVVAGCRPERADFAEQLTTLANDRRVEGSRVEGPRVRGLRRVLHTAPEALCDFDRFAANLRLLSAPGWTFDLCVFAPQLPLAARLADHVPDVTFVLDHCGNPPIASGDLSEWRQGLSAVAQRPNTRCKLSGIVTNADPAHWSAADLRPAVDQVLHAFGPDRIVWGSDWPVCTLAASLGRWVSATHALLDGLTPAEQAAIWGGNASRIYRLGEGGAA